MSTNDPLATRAHLRAEIERLAEVSRSIRDQIELGDLTPDEKIQAAVRRRIIASQRQQCEIQLTKLRAEHSTLFERVASKQLSELKRGCSRLVDRWQDLGAVGFAQELDEVLKACHE